jgi:hypothetical protein
MSNRFVRGLLVLIVLLGGMSARANAQSTTTGAIAGIVRDSTGAVLPGVTVEAASPSLIERVRLAVTDAQGNYKIVDLRPGTYSVTFVLSGFGTLKREGIELTTGFTATVNADLKVGSLQETITVTGASPVVDVQNARTQSVLSKEMLYALPTTQTLQGFAQLTLGATLGSAFAQDVGGAKGEQSGAGNGWAVHGGRLNDQRLLLDGMMFNSVGLGGGAATNSSTYFNRISIAETALVTGGATADTEGGGVVVNNVPKDGGNQMSGLVVAEGTGSKLQGTNLSDDLTARGLVTAPGLLKEYDAGAGLGGPLRKDLLWFYTGHRAWGTYATRPGVYTNATPHSMVFTPDFSQPASRRATHRTDDVRLTWQATPKQKVAGFYQLQDTCKCGDALNTDSPPDGSQGANYPQFLIQSTWNYPRTNKLLFDAGFTALHSRIVVHRWGGSLPTDVPITEQTTGIQYNARGNAVTGNNNYTSGDGAHHHQANQRAAISYVTGSHAFKVGFQMMEGWLLTNQALNDIPGLGPVSYTFRSGAPVSVTEWRSPYGFPTHLMPALGLYGQDQWTLRKLTLNLGLRFDWDRDYALATTVPAIPAFGIPDISFPESHDSTNWKDLSPRMGAAYDVFGNGKTAIKGSLGRYVQVTALGDANAPASRIANSVTRTWTDANRNFVPDCVLSNPRANGECGQISNLLFGQPVATTTTDLTTIQGWGHRPYSWQGSLAMQQQLRPGMAVNVGYFTTIYGNFTVTTNNAVTATDFTPYCVTVPPDSRLGSLSGQQLCGLYDVSPARFGQVSNVNTFASHFGKQIEHYNGVDASLNARFGKGGLLQGGVSTGQTTTDNCAVVTNNPQVVFSSPRTAPFCRVVLSWAGQTQYKVAANYPLAWYGLRVSGTYQNLPAIPLTATNAFTNAQIAPSLGRNLSAGAAGTVTIPIVVPNEIFEQGRVQQLDFRVSKIFQLRHARLTANVDMFNVFNANDVLQVNTSFGPSWLKPLQILDARLFKFGGQLEF